MIISTTTNKLYLYSAKFTKHLHIMYTKFTQNLHENSVFIYLHTIFTRIHTAKSTDQAKLHLHEQVFQKLTIFCRLRTRASLPCQ